MMHRSAFSAAASSTAVKSEPPRPSVVTGALIDALKAGHDRHDALGQGLPDPLRRDPRDSRLGVPAVGDDADLPTRVGSRLDPAPSQVHGQQGDRDPLAGRQQHVHLALIGRGSDVVRQPHEPVCLAAHRGEHHDKVVTGPPSVRDLLRHAMNPLDAPDGGTAVLLDDQGHFLTASALFSRNQSAHQPGRVSDPDLGRFDISLLGASTGRLLGLDRSLKEDVPRRSRNVRLASGGRVIVIDQEKPVRTQLRQSSRIVPTIFWSNSSTNLSLAFWSSPSLTSAGISACTYTRSFLPSSRRAASARLRKSGPPASATAAGSTASNPAQIPTPLGRSVADRTAPVIWY